MTDVTGVLAVLGPHDTGPPVAETATAIARLVGGEVRLLSLAGDLSPRRAAAEAIKALHESRVLIGVLAGDEMSRPVWQRVAQQSPKPVVLVPAGARSRSPKIRRVLLPLDGTARSAAAVAPTAERLTRGGAELVVLHVFDAGTVPKFWDQQAHADQAWTEEFLARYCSLPGTRLELRRGTAAEQVAKVAEAEQADMIALAWSQHVAPGRAPVVLRTVLEAEVPVILVPIPVG
jgi:nucleotide-binding universal stress UspA family protein